ncbi:MAG: hypothetical protein V1847_03365 [Candidatus Diapherotrites archaeon]
MNARGQIWPEKKGVQPWMVGVICILVLAAAILIAAARFDVIYIPGISPSTPAPPSSSKISMLVIYPANCSECVSLKVLETDINTALSGRLETGYLRDFMPDAKTLIQQYNIKRLPTAILDGNFPQDFLDSWAQVGTVELDGNLVFRQVWPPYLDVDSNTAKGLVTAITLEDENCSQCGDAQLVISQLQQAGVYISSDRQQTYSRNSDFGVQAVALYDLKRFPVILFSRDLNDYFIDPSWWEQVGGKTASNGIFLYDAIVPYYDSAQQKIVGVVKVTYLKDDKCPNCYNVHDYHRPMLQAYGMVLDADEKYVDANSVQGKKLIQDYNIRAIPTILLSADANAYQLPFSRFVSDFLQLGTIEKDGVFVLRDLNALQDANGNALVYSQLN